MGLISVYHYFIAAEQTLTKDTVQLMLMLFSWVVWDRKAVLEVADYRNVVAQSAQTALRDLIGETLLAEMWWDEDFG